MQKSDILLTNQELAMASSPLYPSTKYAIFRKLESLFHHIGVQLQLTDPNGNKHPFKLTRGENYREMPYLNLDYPRIAGPEFPFVLRTMFWWGHYFSCNIIIATHRIQSVPVDLASPAFLLWSDAPWENDIQLGYSFSNRIEVLGHQEQYLRISRTLPMENLDQLEIQVLTMAKELNQLLNK